MFSEAVAAAVYAQGKQISVNEVAILQPRETPRGNRIPAVATSWVHRYFSFGPESDVNEREKIPTAFHSSSQSM